MAMFGPDWWHHHGGKMTPTEQSLTPRALTLSGSAAILKVIRVDVLEKHYWQVEWRIVQSRSESSGGTILFTDEDLRIAFGLAQPATPKHSQHLLGRYGGDRAHQGRFFGEGDYLNIPGPGTGHDGDVNLSLEVDDKIKEAISKLLA